MEKDISTEMFNKLLNWKWTQGFGYRGRKDGWEAFTSITSNGFFIIIEDGKGNKSTYRGEKVTELYKKIGEMLQISVDNLP
jgi:hypothetical protein